MLIGYVSDERYVALADVLLEFTDDRGGSWEGITEGIAPDGALRVRRADGGRIAVRFGEVGRVEAL